MNRLQTFLGKGVISIAIILSLVGSIQAAILDLGHPTAAAFIASNVCGGDCDRGVVFDATSGFSITSAGIRFDPLQGGATGISVSIYQSSLNNAFSNGAASHGTLLATASVGIADGGLAFYDIPILFTFQAGSRYDVAFMSTAAGSWGSGLNDLELYKEVN